MRVLEHEHAARAELVDLLDLLRRRPPDVGDEALHDEAGVDRGASPLVDEDVRPLLGDDLAAGPAEHAQRGLVRHRRRRQEERRLVAEQLGHPALQLVGGRILALLLVADLGGRHRSEHSRRRLRDGVGAQVDHDGGRYRSPMDLTLLEQTLARARRARLPRPAGVGVDGARRGRLRRDDEPAARAARGARVGRPVFDA